MRISEVDYHLTIASYHLRDAMLCLYNAEESISRAYDGDEPGYPAPDSSDARAWDYIDAIHDAMKTIGNRLNTWDEGEYNE